MTIPPPNPEPPSGSPTTGRRLIANARDAFEQQSQTSDPSSHPTSTDGAHLSIRCPHCGESVQILVDVPWKEITCIACGEVFSLAADERVTRELPPLKQIAQFELIERIGVGGFGTVWKARDTMLDRVVALKLPRRGLLTETDVNKFLREARAAAQLQHPNIVSVHEVGRTDETVYIVNDLVRGVAMCDWLAMRQPGPREVAQLFRKLADALRHAHEAGIIHRDLKPGNIMIDADGEPHIMDFGLAKRDAGEVTMTVEGQVLGTPAYMAPEQARGDAHRCVPGTDLFSLGVVMYESLTGELPFRGAAAMLLHQVIHDDPTTPRKLNQYVPPDLETICLKCLEKEPSQRFASAKLLRDELDRFLRGEPILSRPLGPFATAWRWCVRHTSVVGSLTAVLFMVIMASAISTYFVLRATGYRQLADEALAERDRSARALQRVRESTDNNARNLGDATSGLFAAATNSRLAGLRNQLRFALPLLETDPYRALQALESPRADAASRDFAWGFAHRRAHRPRQVISLPAGVVVDMRFDANGNALAILTPSTRYLLQRHEETSRWTLVSQSALNRSHDAQHRSVTLANAEADASALRPTDLATVVAGDSRFYALSPNDNSSLPWCDTTLAHGERWTAVAIRNDAAQIVALASHDDRQQPDDFVVIESDSGKILGKLPADGWSRPRFRFQGSDLAVWETDPNAPARYQLRTVPDFRLRSEQFAPAPIRFIAGESDRPIVVADAVYARAKSNALLRLTSRQGNPTAACWSASTQQLAVVTSSGALQLWDLSAPDGEWSAPGQLTCVEYSTDAVKIAAADDQHLTVFGSLTGNEMRKFSLQSRIADMTWNRDNTKLAVCQSDGVLRLASFSGRSELSVVALGDIVVQRASFVDETFLLLGTVDGRVIGYNVRKGDTEALAQLTAPIVDVEHCSSANFHVAACADRIELFYPDEDPMTLAVPEAFRVTKIRVSQHGRTVLALTAEGRVLLWNIHWQHRRAAETPHVLPATAVVDADFSTDKRTIVTASADGADAWDAKTFDFSGTLRAGPVHLVRFAPHPVTANNRLAIVDSRGLAVLSAYDDRRHEALFVDTVRTFLPGFDSAGLIAVGDAAMAMNVLPQSDSVQYAGWAGSSLRCATLRPSDSQKNARLYAVSWERHLLEFEVQPDRRVLRLTQKIDLPVDVVAIHDDGQQTIVRTAAGQVGAIVNGADGIASFKPWAESVTLDAIASCISRDRRTVFVGTASGSILTWDRIGPSQWKRRPEPIELGSDIEQLESLDNGKIAIVGDDLLQVWDVEARQQTLSTGHRGAHAVAVSPDRQWLATAAGASCQLWQLTPTRIVPVAAPWQEHESVVTALQFTPDGKYVFSAGEDRIVWPHPVPQDTATATVPDNVADREDNVAGAAEGSGADNGGDDDASSVSDTSVIPPEVLRMFEQQSP